mmetsp:Transcript_3188/g.11360  ORF Transcript_3188/g.11360 Transcript_3188/m.11360 type:complete len:96 (-) Transcript_3188:1144-1431(-)
MQISSAQDKNGPFRTTRVMHSTSVGFNRMFPSCKTGQEKKPRLFLNPAYSPTERYTLFGWLRRIAAGQLEHLLSCQMVNFTLRATANHGDERKSD